MKNRTSLLNKYIATEEGLHIPSINDLREKELSGEPLTVKEKQALVNFDQFRLDVLNAQTDDISFHNRYKELQVMANLGDYTEFLKEKYFL